MIDRAKAPKPNGTVNFQIPEIKLIKAPNGTEIYYVQKEKLPIVQLYVLVSSGSKFDPIDKLGLAFITSLMIDEGAGAYDSLQLNNEFEKLGTILGISVDHDTFAFSLLSLKENFSRSFELLSNILNEPHLAEKDFNREKKKILDRILQLKDEPSYIASQVFDKRVFGSSYYGQPELGFDNTVQNITLQDVKHFYSDTLLNSNIQVVAVGNITKDELIDLCAKYIPQSGKLINKHELVIPGKSKTKYYFVNKKDSAQSEIRVGHIAKPRDAEDYYAAKIMNTILGGQFSSRINLNLREHKGFTYGANSSFNHFQNTGWFEVSTSVNIQNTGEAITEILKELNGIRQIVKDDEISFAKSYLIKQFPSRFETYSQTARNIIPILVHSLPLDYYNGYTKSLESTTNIDITKAASDNIFPEDLIVLAVGDKNQIEPQLKEIAGDELIELDIYGERIN